jgi:hypothetical protein
VARFFFEEFHMADSNKIHTMRHPDGRIVQVNEEGVMTLARLGYHVPLTAPSGEHGYVPLQNVQAAVDAGFTFGHQVGDQK